MDYHNSVQKITHNPENLKNHVNFAKEIIPKTLPE